MAVWPQKQDHRQECLVGVAPRSPPNSGGKAAGSMDRGSENSFLREQELGAGWRGKSGHFRGNHAGTHGNTLNARQRGELGWLQLVSVGIHAGV